MLLNFSDNSTIELDIYSNHLGNTYQKIYKNLSYVPIPFAKWDNPYYYKNFSYAQLVEHLAFYAEQVSVVIDKNLCLEKNQKYFNKIHEIYEKNYNGAPAWLNFHDHIHLCENYDRPCKFLNIDYKEKAGLLERPFDMAWLTTATTKIKKGDIYVQWAELGKTPYQYWKNNESSEISRLCTLAVPWLKLRPIIKIAIDDIDTMEHLSADKFTGWWNHHSAPWCEHWGLNSWTLENMYSAAIFGNVPNIDLLILKLKNNIGPTKVLLRHR